MTVGLPQFSGQENNDRTRSLKEIISLNDNGDNLIDRLNLKNLRAKPTDAENKGTRILNTSGTLVYETIEGDRYLSRKVKGFQDSSYKKYPLVDLGTNGEAFIAIFAQEIEVPGVIAVDIGLQIDPRYLESLKNSDKGYKDKNFPILGLKIDMLELLKQFPDNSCNISLFSIDNVIIESDAYGRNLIEQLRRVVPDDGLVFGRNSIMSLTTEDDWTNLVSPSNDMARRDIGIFKKVPRPPIT